MARKSRRNAGAAAPVTKNDTAEFYSTAIYARLSVENSGKDDDGDSIDNQIHFCKEYLKTVGDLRLYDIYEDNGEKGTRFDRPEFQRLMDDIRSGAVRCVVVKDLSRFGRNYLEAGEYLEKIFPFLGVRFISITDGYDSLLSPDAEGALMVPLKNMINDAYAKDISRKIITSFRARQERGEFLPAFPPYGYVKSKTRQYRYEPDPVTAPFVKLIFEWKADRVSHSEICKRLNEMGAITPSRRKVELGIWKAEKYKHTVWYGRTILDILQNRTYTGCLVYGRMKKSLYQGIKLHRTKQEEQIILPNMHEAIVSEELFDKVQQIFEDARNEMHRKMEESETARENITNLFKGKIYCGDCGKRMRFIKGQSRKTKEYLYPHYMCGGYIDSGMRRCSKHTTPYDKVKDAVFKAIQGQLYIALEQEKLLQRLKGSTVERDLLEQYDGQYRAALREVDQLTSRREKLFEHFTEGILDEEEYRFAKEKYAEQAAVLEKKLAAARERKQQLTDVLSGNSKWLQALRCADGAEKVDQKMAAELIDRIRIFEECRIEVTFNYCEDKAVFENVVKALKEAE